MSNYKLARELKGKWDKKKRGSQPFYYMFNYKYNLRALVDTHSNIVFMITDLTKKETVYNPDKGINRGAEYGDCF